jgi:hypothetical protein
MLKKYLVATAFTVVLGAFASGTMVPAASAATPIGNPFMTTSDQGVQLAGEKKRKHTKKHNKKVWVYNSGRHGKRYRYKRGPYAYYYGGYYYARPWWTYGPAYGPVYGPGINLCIGC